MRTRTLRSTFPAQRASVQCRCRRCFGRAAIPSARAAPTRWPVRPVQHDAKTAQFHSSLGGPRLSCGSPVLTRHAPSAPPGGEWRMRLLRSRCRARRTQSHRSYHLSHLPLAPGRSAGNLQSPRAVRLAEHFGRVSGGFALQRRGGRERFLGARRYC